MGEPSRLCGEYVLANQELRGGEAVLHVPDVRLRIGEIFPEDVEGLHLAVQEAVDHLGNHQSRFFRKFFHLPGGGKFFPRLGVVHPLVAREDIGQGSHVAGPLDVVLPPQGVDAPAFEADIAQEHLEVRAGHDVVDTTDMFGDPQGVHEHGGAVGRETARHGPDHVGPDPADRRGPLRRIFQHLLLQFFETHGAGFNKILIVEILGDKDVHHPVQEGHVGAYLYLYMQVGQIHEGRSPGIHHDHLGAADHRHLQQ